MPPQAMQELNREKNLPRRRLPLYLSEGYNKRSNSEREREPNPETRGMVTTTGVTMLLLHHPGTSNRTPTAAMMDLLGEEDIPTLRRVAKIGRRRT